MILLTGLAPVGVRQVLGGGTYHPQGEQLATTVDEIRRRHGHQVIGYGPTGQRGPHRWDMRREHLSPAGTTTWTNLLTVR